MCYYFIRALGTSGGGCKQADLQVTRVLWQNDSPMGEASDSGPAHGGAALGSPPWVLLLFAL